MEKIIYTKENGETTKGIRTILTHKSAYLRKDEIISFIDNDEVKKYNGKEKVEAKRAIVSIFRAVRIEDPDKIFELFDQIQNVTDGKEVTKILNDLLKYYRVVSNRENNKIKKYYNPNLKDNSVNNFKTLIETKPELMNSIAVKKIIRMYFTEMLGSFSDKYINKVETIKNSNVEIDELFDMLSVEFTDNAKKNGVYELSKRVLNDTIDYIYDERQNHLCWNCKNATAIDCDKVADCFKNTIDLYDFIDEGYQTYNGKELDRFVVTKCKKFKRDTKK